MPRPFHFVIISNFTSGRKGRKREGGKGEERSSTPPSLIPLQLLHFLGEREKREKKGKSWQPAAILLSPLSFTLLLRREGGRGKKKEGRERKKKRRAFTMVSFMQFLFFFPFF